MSELLRSTTGSIFPSNTPAIAAFGRYCFRACQVASWMPGLAPAEIFHFTILAPHVVGIDFSPAMLARAKRRINRSTAASIELKTMDVTALDFPDCSFDAAVATFLFCVLPDDSQVAALRELGRVVKAGGMIRLLNYVRPRGRVRGAIARLWQPFAAWAFAASFDPSHPWMH
jgi:ubiquinone/menaquinone biosynthesis C-methylase UbiE